MRSRRKHIVSAVRYAGAPGAAEPITGLSLVVWPWHTHRNLTVPCATG